MHPIYLSVVSCLDIRKKKASNTLYRFSTLFVNTTQRMDIERFRYSSSALTVRSTIEMSPVADNDLCFVSAFLSNRHANCSTGSTRKATRKKKRDEANDEPITDVLRKFSFLYPILKWVTRTEQARQRKCLELEKRRM